ncbi:DegT/DnrJ/EryC1/StrS family aminotransferase [Planctomycetota bacterium]
MTVRSISSGNSSDKTVPLVDDIAPRMRYSFGTITVTEKARQLVNEALTTGRVSCGRMVREFEQRFAEIVGAKEAVTVSSGTEADALACAVLYDYGAQRGDEIITAAHSFAATGNAILQAGFTPVFADIDLETFNIDPDLIEEAITDKTRAIMPIHLMGKPAPMDRIMAIAGRHGLTVIGDAAEAHGSKYQGRNVAQWGHMTAYSLYVAHIISTVEGGVVVTDNEDYAEILRSLRSHGRFCKCKSCVVNRADQYCAKRHVDGKDMRFVFERLGFSCKMNELEAAVGLGSLEHYDAILEKRHDNLLYLINGFQRFAPMLWTLSEGSHERIGPHAFPVIVGKDAPFTRDQLLDYLSRSGIDPRDLFSCMPTQCQGFGFLGHRLGDFPNSEYLGENGLHVGVHQDLNRDDLDYFIDTIDRFIDSYS